MKISGLKINAHLFLFAFALFITAFYNIRFFKEAFSEIAKNGYYDLIFLPLIFALVLFLAFEILTICRFLYKFVAICFILIVALCKYFIEDMGFLMNQNAIDSFLNTNLTEMSEFISLNLAIYLLFFAILPIFVIFKVKFKQYLLKSAILQKFGAVFASFCLLGGFWLYLGSNFTFLFKNSNTLQFVMNPISAIREVVIYATSKKVSEFSYIANDAKLENDANLTFVLIIGESARADNLAFNGYSRDTNPFSKDEENLVNFSKFYSCGTITRISIPCMLTNFTRQNFDQDYARMRQNILDIAQMVGFEVYWFGNNGRCANEVCKRIKNVKYYPENSFDGVMLSDINATIFSKNPRKFIIINERGSHGPIYSDRYPKNFEKFSPVCKDRAIQKCEKNEIVNAYDNSLIYTDFISKSVIDMLKKREIPAIFWFISDHGESLGEGGLFMHGSGISYALSPSVQKHIASYIWFSGHFGELLQKAKAKSAENLNQDFVFHTLLYLLNIKTSAYDEKLNIFK